MRRLVFAVACVCAIVSLPAVAVDHTVTAMPNLTFSPASLTIDAGDTVTFVNGGGFHNVVSDSGAVTAFRCANGCDADGGNGDASGAAWSATVTFPDAGSAPFHCEIHGANGGVGMSGTITIVAGGAPAIAVSPPSLEATAEAGGSASTALSIANTGTADLVWNADSASADCSAPGDVPWIALAPASGTIAAGDPATDVDVTLDAASLAPGLYSANVCVHSNDAANDPLAVPVSFTVNTPDLVFQDGFDG
jgi:plastocyanin